MNIIVQKPGIHTTVQDLGRYGYQKLGINPGGVMDPMAAKLVNILLGNGDNEAVLEMHYPAPRYLFDADAICAIGGADFAPAVDGLCKTPYISYKLEVANCCAPAPTVINRVRTKK